MASLAGFQQISHPHPDIVLVDGYFMTDASGKVVNEVSQAQALTDGYVDIYGNGLALPREIDSVTLSGTGQYTIHLKQAWHRVRSVFVQPVGHTIKNGSFQVTAVNGQGATALGEVGQTVVIQFQSGGSSAAFVSAGFYLMLVCRNSSA